METILNVLASSWSTYTPGMNQSQRGMLGGLLHTIENDILNAYANYLNYTSADELHGPTFWYMGISHPT